MCIYRSTKRTSHCKINTLTTKSCNQGICGAFTTICKWFYDNILFLSLFCSFGFGFVQILTGDFNGTVVAAHGTVFIRAFVFSSSDFFGLDRVNG